jgi:cytochrome P450
MYTAGDQAAGITSTASAPLQQLHILPNTPLQPFHHFALPVLHSQIRTEQAAVQAQHGTQLTPAAIAAMPYTTAVVKETLRTAQVVGYVPRVATQQLKVPNGGPEMKSGCPFIVALGAMAGSDPAHQPAAAAAADAADPAAAAGAAAAAAAAGSSWDFQPERWLQPEHAKSLALHQAPFGMGAHYCLGSQLALAELTAVLAELGRSYSLTANTDTEWRGEVLHVWGFVWLWLGCTLLCLNVG